MAFKPCKCHPLPFESTHPSFLPWVPKPQTEAALQTGWLGQLNICFVLSDCTAPVVHLEFQQKRQIANKLIFKTGLE